jgi:hypothetical protein
MINNHWISITHHDSKPLAQHNTPWITTTGSVKHTMIINHWLSKTHHDSQPLAQHSTPWFTTTGLQYHATIESWCVMLSQLLWIIVNYAEPVVANHGVSYEASGCELWCAMLCQPLAQHSTPWFTTTGLQYHATIHSLWHSITIHDSQPLTQHNTPWLITTGSLNHTMIEPVVVNHGVLFWASGCESWCVMLS